MEWQSSMGGFNFAPPQMMMTMAGAVDEHDSQNENENEEDFYGDVNDVADTRVGAAEDDDDDDAQASGDLLSSLLPQQPPQALPPQTPQPKIEQGMSAEEKKLENQRTAQRLRAQLLAKRQNTPLKPATHRAETPTRMQVQPAPQTAVKADTSPVPATKRSGREDTLAYAENLVVHGQPSQDDIDLDSMIADAKRTAEAKASEIKAKGHVQHPSALAASTNKQVNATPMREVEQKAITTSEKSLPTQLNDAYYADLPAWLELTGYHDVEYRTSKLRTRRERKALEDEVARIQAKLDQLKEQEAAEMQALRTIVAHPTSFSSIAPPPLLTKLPSEEAQNMAGVAANLTNGVKKRPHSPPPTTMEKNVRRRDDATNGFRIRGANGSPTSPRNGYNDYRRSSFDARSRDSSLERRQSYYRRAGGPPPPPSAAVNDRYAPYSPRDGRSTPGSYGSGRGAYTGRGGRGSRPVVKRW
ncbi:hypothetical protein LTR78_004062 [Recurvomyces mirabilis]|uniref:Uncharacterized protein n=1 Tax=Recurvomyces mirabilis TaxID=574656 RepID=A0AAE0WQ69_9PEZI|nr:hypothetical protein LTR78_004062 [Recurvomyces mirabilis]KAK5153764.1 hypothetical protein LTS14_007458 [Recurvomyces mirabilis]